jgi:hypothetical protein
VLTEQLAQLQNDNVKLTFALQLEQHVKKELDMKKGQIQENLNKLKDFIELKS